MEDDEDVSNIDKSSIHVDNNNVDENLQTVTTTEQCESVHEPIDSQLAGELEPADPKDDIADVEGAVEEKEPVVGDSRFAVESEPGLPDVDGDDEPEEELECPPEIERCESVPEVDGGSRVSGESEEPVVAEETVEDKAVELLEPSSDEKCELDDVKLVGESESAAVRDNDDVDDIEEDKGEELHVIVDTEKCEEVPETTDPELVVELGIAAKDGEDEDSAVVKEEEIPEAVTELEHSQPVGDEAPVVTEEDVGEVAKEEVTSLSISELSDSQLGQQSELVAVKEDNDDAIAEEEEEKEVQMEVAELDDTQLVGEAELSVAKEDEDEDMVVEEKETPTAKEDDDIVTEEQEIPTAVEDEDEDEDMVAEEQEIATADTEMETETEVGRGGGKRKRGGRSSKVTGRVQARKTVEEDVCFICFDGGDLVLCDRRGCPKAYHPSCVNRDEAFFRAKGRWNCGWHLCSICEKNANYMCYTCTYSLCKGCIKDAVILCVRGNKGFCETCMKTVMLIERNELGKGEMAKVDFDDKSSWEYLFKDYWSDLKGKLLLSLEEVAQAKSPWKGSDVLGDKQGFPVELNDANNENGSGSDNPSGNKASTPRRRKAKKRIKPLTKEEDSASASDNSGDASKSKRRKAKKQSKSRTERDSPSALSAVSAEGTSMSGRSEWASKELLEFVMHMKDGDTSVLSQFDVQALLLEYIKRNKLRDPRRKSQIICDLRLQNLFGKPRVGHFEMLKLLESHFLIREDSQADDLQGTVVDTETSQLDVDGSTDAQTKAGKDRKRKARRKGDERALQSNVDDFAAIDTHNINLVYLRRNVMEALLEDSDYFYDKVVGSFVRIRISGSNQKQEMYRLVQVVGTSKAAEPYKVVKRTTDIILEIQNLNKKEVISMDIISNQEFTEDECKRLRQSIKCGLINRLTLGDIQEKAMALQEVRVNDWLEAEVVRLSHLRDRASETGRRKELRECVEKLQRLKTPEERQRRLEEFPEVHSDPNMDPSYESEEDEAEPDDKKQDNYMRPRGTSFSRRGREPVSPRSGGSLSNDSWSGTRNNSSTRELSRNMSSRGFSNRREDAAVTGDLVNENTWTQERNRDRQPLNNWDMQKAVSTSELGGRNSSHSVVASESFSGVLSETSPPSLSAGVAHATAKINETDKMWLYRDPAGKVQGPFSMGQLRKWSITGYFPKDLRIWKNTENQDDSLLLTNALIGNFQKESNAQSAHNPHLSSSYSGKLYGTALQSATEGQGGQSSKGSSEASGFGTNGWNSDHGGRSDTSNLPSPTPSRTTAGNSGGQASEYNLSPNSFPAQPFSSAPKTPQSGQLSHLSTPPSASASLSRGLDSSNVSHATFTQQTNNEHNGVEYSGAMSSSVLSSSRQLTQGSQNDLPSSFPNVSSTFQPEMGISSENGLQFQAGSQGLPGPESAAASVDQSADTGGAGGGLPNLVQSGTTYNLSTESYGWSSGSVANQKVEQSNQSPMPVQQPAYSQWGSATSPAVHNSASSFSAANPVGNLPVAGFSGSTDSWRPHAPVNQASMQPTVQPNLPWSMGNTDNSNTAPRLGQETNTGWGPMPGHPNMGWGGPAPGNTNMNWGATGQGPAPGTVNPNWATSGQGPPPGNANPNWVAPAPGNTNQGWVPSGQGPPPGNANPNWVAPGNANPTWVAPVQSHAPGNAFPGWVAPGQGPAPGNASSNWVVLGNTNPGWIAPAQVPAPGNSNSGWIAPSQGPASGNSNQGWVQPNSNSGMWGSEQNHNGDRNQRDRGSQAGHSGSGGGRAWNRQSSFGNGGGGDSSRPPPRGQRVCEFHKNGHCRKGANCDRMHT